MSTFDDSIAQAVAEYRAREQDILARTAERDAAESGAAFTAGLLLDAQNAITDLLAELAECRNPTPPPPPVVRVPVGSYSGSMQELAAREQQLGVTIPSTWFFGRMDTIMNPAWGYDRDNFDVWLNIHCRVGTAHGNIQWREVTSTTKYDIGLKNFLESVGGMTRARIWLPIQEEMDGEGKTHGGSDDYKKFFLKLYAYAKQYCPRAKVGMCFADANNAKDYVLPEAEFLAANPHWYTVNGTTGLYTKGPLVDVIKQQFDALVAAGLGDRPYWIHTGFAEPMTEPQALALRFANGAGSQPGNITAGNLLVSDPMTKVRMVREELRPFLTATLPWRKPDGLTIWDRSQLTNNRAADERINSSLGDNGAASLAAFKELMTP